jgi:hypothetical protein
MPAGSHWTLRYDATVDGRIQARDHAHHLRLDEFVQHVDLKRDRHGEITLGVQFYDDRERPYDENLAREVQRYQVVQREPEPERGPPRSIQQLLEDFINTPITRVRVGQAFAAPIRNRLDYVSTARRSMLVLDPPYDFRMHRQLDNARLGDAVHQPLPLSQESLHTALEDIAQISRMFADILQVPQELLQPPVPVEPLSTMADVPKWLKAGVWVKSNSKDSFAQVLEIEDNVMINGPFVRIKHWRSCSVGVPLKLFLSHWVQCEKPTEPLSRYERIIRGI